MSKIKWPADGKITSGRGIGDYVYCLDDVDYYPMRLKFERIIKDNSILIPRPIYSDMYGHYLFDNIGDAKKYFSFTPQTVAKIEILASTSTGPSASDFVAGTLIGGVALGAAAAMSTVGSQHTVKVTWRDDHDSKESIITFNNSTGFQTFIGKLGSLINQPNEATPAISSPVTSSADEILKFKKLMDEGIITQAEFEAKKQQLLGIENTVINSSKADIARIQAKKAPSADEILKLIKSMFNGLITQAQFDAKKKQLLGIKNTVINSTEADNPEYYSVVITSNYEGQTLDRATLPYEIFATTSKPDAEKVAKVLSSAGKPIEIRQPKSDGGFVVTTFKNGYAVDENQPKVEAIDLEARQKDPEVGDEIYFGTNNGQRMRCKVLEKQDHKILVITTDIVCKKPYHETDKNITWSECTLRKWLNSDFLNGYFTQEERDRILPWKIRNNINPEYKTRGGIDTTDQVFLLSIEEARSLFANDQERSIDIWWLRSPGVEPTNAAAVERNGEVKPFGYGITQTYVGVRPALWLNLISEKEAKKRLDDYWEAHSDERKKLEEEQNALKDQITSLNVSCKEQVEAIKKEIAAIPGKDELDNLDARIKKLSNDIAALGIFKGKEKKALEDQIAQAEADKRIVQKRMSAEKEALEQKSSAIKREIMGKISQLQSRAQSINAELIKER